MLDLTAIGESRTRHEPFDWGYTRQAVGLDDAAGRLLSPDYRQALARATGRSLDDVLLEASVWRSAADAQLGPHLDLASKVLTQVFYFNVAWRVHWGGCLRILRSSNPDDVADEVPPALGSASILVRSERSWHSVTPVQPEAPAERLSLIVTLLHPGSVSPAWLRRDDGQVVPTVDATPEDGHA